MFAVIKTGGKQYRVEKGSILEIEKLPVEEGGEVVFEEVLLYHDGAKVTVGTPRVAQMVVVGKVREQKKGDKVIVFKYKKRKRYSKLRGHRQLQTTVEITDIAKAAAPKKVAAKVAVKKPAVRKERKQAAAA